MERQKQAKKEGVFGELTQLSIVIQADEGRKLSAITESVAVGGGKHGEGEEAIRSENSSLRSRPSRTKKRSLKKRDLDVSDKRGGRY